MNESLRKLVLDRKGSPTAKKSKHAYVQVNNKNRI